MNRLLAGDVLNNLLDILMKTHVIVALVLASVGICMAVIAKPVAKRIRKSEEPKDYESLMLVFKAIGLVMIIIALVMIIIP